MTAFADGQTDQGVLSQGYVTITPLQSYPVLLDNLQVIIACCDVS